MKISESKRIAMRKNATRPFVGVDGEGGNQANGYHAYFLLRVGDSHILPRPGHVRLTTSDCLAFLAGQDPDAIHVGYFFDYDSTKILEDMSSDHLGALMNRVRRTRDGRTYPVKWSGFQIDYLPHKELKVRRGKFGEGAYGPWITVNDVGPFFQCRFVEALEKWGVGDGDQRRAVADGKTLRGSFKVEDLADIDEYNRLEIVLLEELMEKFRDACLSVDLIPARWQGPGLLAKELMERHHVPKSKDVPILADEELTRFATNAYYGGRPELSAVGPVNKPLWQYDINSAYPAAMLDVPCLVHGTWLHERDPASHQPGYALVYGTFSPLGALGERKPMWYGLPVRNKQGGIAYPGAGRGWYWNFEVEASRHQHFRVEESWRYIRECDCQPLGFVADVYQQRLSLGKDGAGVPLKLALNSLYGICAQSIGRPAYANPIWASFITAKCRTQIQHFIHGSPMCAPGKWCGSDVFMVATDSVVSSTERTDIVVGKGLGEWSEEAHPDGMFFIQPGLYFGSSGKRAKTRGVPVAAVTRLESEFRAAFARMSSTGNLADGDVTVPQTVFVGIRYALHRRNRKLLGQWIEFINPETGENGKKIRFDWTSKRASAPVLGPEEGVRDHIQTFPLLGDPNTATVPYDKNIGGKLNEARLSEADGPDWASFITPQGER